MTQPLLGGVPDVNRAAIPKTIRVHYGAITFPADRVLFSRLFSSHFEGNALVSSVRRLALLPRRGLLPRGSTGQHRPERRQPRSGHAFFKNQPGTRPGACAPSACFGIRFLQQKGLSSEIAKPRGGARNPYVQITDDCAALPSRLSSVCFAGLSPNWSYA